MPSPLDLAIQVYRLLSFSLLRCPRMLEGYLAGDEVLEYLRAGREQSTMTAWGGGAWSLQKANTDMSIG